MLFLPATASAHVKLRRSEPGANAMLTAPPLELKLWFSETVELSVTRIALTDSAGKPVAMAAPIPADGETSGLQMKLFTTLVAGRYKVTWNTFGLDGHRSEGSFTFRVLGEGEVVDTAFAAEAARAERDSMQAAAAEEAIMKPADVLDMRSFAPAYVLVRVISFTALLLVIGAVAFRLLVLQPTAPSADATWKRIGSRVASLASLVALAYVFAALARGYLQTRLVSGNDVPNVDDMTRVMMSTNWGMYWRVQVAAMLTASLALVIGGSRRPGAWAVTGIAAVGAAFATSLGSHAGASDTMHLFGVLDDAVHILAVSAWLGGLFWLVIIALPMLATSEGRSRRATLLVEAFSRVALACAGIAVFTGVVSARFRVGTLHALVSSPYGQTLLLKLLFVLGVAAAGYYNWKRVRPAMGAEGALDTLRKSGKRELIVACLVIVVTAVLVALPLPTPA